MARVPPGSFTSSGQCAQSRNTGPGTLASARGAATGGATGAAGGGPAGPGTPSARGGATGAAGAGAAGRACTSAVLDRAAILTGGGDSGRACACLGRARSSPRDSLKERKAEGGANHAPVHRAAG